jgi:hypothetical protein
VPPPIAVPEPAVAVPEPPIAVPEPAFIVPEAPIAAAAEPESPTPTVEAPTAVVVEAATEQLAEAASPPAAPAVLVLQTEGRAFLYWRLPALSESWRLRSVTVRPSLEGPEVEEQDHLLTIAVGGFWLSRQTPGTEVRAALGELSREGFSPLAVARVVGPAAAEPFVPLGTDVDDELETSARSAAGL